MYTINKPSQLTYYVYTQSDNSSLIHPGSVDSTQCVSSGLDTEQTYLDHQDWIDRLNELGKDTTGL